MSDARWQNEYLGTSTSIQMSTQGSLVCTLAMILNWQNLPVLGYTADPYVLNYYLNSENWDGTTAQFPWSSLNNLGLKLQNILFVGSNN